jgi:hypothetical protein
MTFGRTSARRAQGAASYRQQHEARPPRHPRRRGAIACSNRRGGYFDRQSVSADYPDCKRRSASAPGPRLAAVRPFRHGVVADLRTDCADLRWRDTTRRPSCCDRRAACKRRALPTDCPRVFWASCRRARCFESGCGKPGRPDPCAGHGTKQPRPLPAELWRWQHRYSSGTGCAASTPAGTARFCARASPTVSGYDAALSRAWRRRTVVHGASQATRIADEIETRRHNRTPTQP